MYDQFMSRIRTALHHLSGLFVLQDPAGFAEMPEWLLHNSLY